MRKNCRNLTLLVLLTYPIDLIRIVSPVISIFRIVLVLALILTGVSSLARNSLVIKKLPFFYILITLMGAIMALIVSRDQQYAVSAFINEGAGICFLILMVLNFSKRDLPLLLRTFVIAQLSAAFFALFTLKYLGHPEFFPRNVRFFKVFFLQLDERFLDTLRLMRLTLPYPNSAAMSVAMAICIGILVFGGECIVKSRILRWLMIIVYTVLLVGTQSRTGIVAFVVTMAISVLGRPSEKKMKYVISSFVACIVAIVPLIPRITSNVIVTKFITRVNNELTESILSNRHLLVPLEGLATWLSTTFVFWFGKGYGGNQFLDTHWTYLPNNSFLCSYVTVITDRGLLGLIIIFLWFVMLYKVFHLQKGRVSSAIQGMYGILLISCIFYELYLSNICWSVLGIVLVASSRSFDEEYFPERYYLAGTHITIAANAVLQESEKG